MYAGPPVAERDRPPAADPVGELADVRGAHLLHLVRRRDVHPRWRRACGRRSTRSRQRRRGRRHRRRRPSKTRTGAEGAVEVRGPRAARGQQEPIGGRILDEVRRVDVVEPAVRPLWRLPGGVDGPGAPGVCRRVVRPPSTARSMPQPGGRASRGRRDRPGSPRRRRPPAPSPARAATTSDRWPGPGSVEATAPTTASTTDRTRAVARHTRTPHGLLGGRTQVTVSWAGRARRAEPPADREPPWAPSATSNSRRHGGGIRGQGAVPRLMVGCAASRPRCRPRQGSCSAHTRRHFVEGSGRGHPSARSATGHRVPGAAPCWPVSGSEGNKRSDGQRRDTAHPDRGGWSSLPRPGGVARRLVSDRRAAMGKPRRLVISGGACPLPVVVPEVGYCFLRRSRCGGQGRDLRRQ